MTLNATIVSIGTELTTGLCLDTNAQWLSQRLAALGVHVESHVTVGDDIATLAEVIRQALNRSDVVIATGGLGPTSDDRTREALSEALGVPLETNADALQQIRTFFDNLHRPMPKANEVQALVPRGCEYIPNQKGTAPGLRFSGEGRSEPRGSLFALPGVPSEMMAMFDGAIAPLLSKRSQGACLRTSSLHVFGLDEASLGETIRDLIVPGRNPNVGTTASQGVISIRIVAYAADASSADRLIRADVETLRRRLGSTVFGENEQTLPFVVGQSLTKSGETLATAESCTGGLLATCLTDIPGSSAYLKRGYVTYDNEAKMALLNVPEELLGEHGAVSHPVAAAMAKGCREAAKSDFSLAITGIAGPAGGSPPAKPVGLVFVALASAGGETVKQLRLGEHLARTEIRDRSCKAALNLLRLYLHAANDD